MRRRLPVLAQALRVCVQGGLDDFGDDFGDQLDSFMEGEGDESDSELDSFFEDLSTIDDLEVQEAEPVADDDLDEAPAPEAHDDLDDEDDEGDSDMGGAATAAAPVAAAAANCATTALSQTHPSRHCCCQCQTLGSFFLVRPLHIPGDVRNHLPAGQLQK